MKSLKIRLFGAATLLGMMLLTSGINAGEYAPESEEIEKAEPSQSFMQRGWQYAKNNPKKAAVGLAAVTGTGFAARRYMQNRPQYFDLGNFAPRVTPEALEAQQIEQEQILWDLSIGIIHLQMEDFTIWANMAQKRIDEGEGLHGDADTVPKYRTYVNNIATTLTTLQSMNSKTILKEYHKLNESLNLVPIGAYSADQGNRNVNMAIQGLGNIIESTRLRALQPQDEMLKEADSDTVEDTRKPSWWKNPLQRFNSLRTKRQQQVRDFSGEV